MKIRIFIYHTMYILPESVKDTQFQIQYWKTDQWSSSFWVVMLPLLKLQYQSAKKIKINNNNYGFLEDIVSCQLFTSSTR